MQFTNWFLAASSLVALAPPAFAQGSLADRFPADAIFYVEGDTRRLVDGALSLDLVKLLDEAQVQEFLKPLAAQLPGPVSTQGLRSMVDTIPWRQFVDGRVEIAMRGVHVDVNGQGFDFSATQPLTARALNRLAGVFSTMAGQEGDGQGLNVSMSLDMVAHVDGGEQTAGLIETALGHLRNHGPGAATQESCQIAGRNATRYTLSMGGNVHQVAYLVRDGNSFWLAGSAATLERCLKGGAPQDSLARSRVFQDFKQQVSSGDPALLAYVNVANAARIFDRLIAPIVKEELDLFGISSIEAFGMASTFVEGGVRDSIALTFNGPPTGFVSLLDCTDGGFDLLKRAPAETGFYLGARIDAEAFVDKLVKVSEELFPGSSRALEAALAQASAMSGMDVRSELLAAFGDEIGVYLTAPGAGSLLPSGMVMIEVGDREQFEKLITCGLREAQQQGIEASAIKSLPEGTSGWAITIPEAPFQPAIALTKDHFLVARDVLSLKASLKESSRAPASTIADNANLQHVLKGLTGAPNTKGLSLLAFVDLQKLVEFGYQFTPMLASNLQNSGLALDFSELPETEVIARHFSGIGVAGRSDTKGLVLSFFTPTGLFTGGMLAAPWVILASQPPAPVMYTEFGGDEEDGEEIASEVVPPPSKPAPAGRVRSLADLFASIEKATGATIDFPAELGDVQVSYTPRTGDLSTMLSELSSLAGFSFEVREVDGDTLVVVSEG